MKLSDVVSKNIKYIRIINSMSQEDLANEMGINQSHISAIERGDRIVSLDRLERIAKVLNVEPYIFLKEDLQKSMKKEITGRMVRR